MQTGQLERGRVLKFLMKIHLGGGVFLRQIGGGGRRLGNVDLDFVVVRLMGREELRTGAVIVTSVLRTEHIQLKLRGVVAIERVWLVEHGLIPIPYPNISEGAASTT
jgi:hypothetical protein